MDPYRAGISLGQVFGAGQTGYDQQIDRRYAVAKSLEEARQARSKAVLADQNVVARQGLTGELVGRARAGDVDALNELTALGLTSNENVNMGVLGQTQEFALRQAARDKAVLGDPTGYNAELIGLAKGPLEMTKISDGVAYNPYGQSSQDLNVTPLGDASIAQRRASAASSYASANSSNASAARTLQATALDRDSVLGSGATRGGGGKAPSGYRWREDGGLEAIPGGPADKGGGPLGGPAKLTEGQGKDVVYYTRGNQANKLLDTMDMNLSTLGGQQGKLRGLADTAIRNLPLGLGEGGLGNSVVSSERQQAEQAGLEFLSAILRKDTGAAITPAEIGIYGKTYLPQPGDSPDLLEQKRNSRQTALAAIESGLGSAAAAIPDLSSRDVLGARPAGSRLKPSPGLPAAPASAAPVQRARNPNTGQVVVLRNGQWVPE